MTSATAQPTVADATASPRFRAVLAVALAIAAAWLVRAAGPASATLDIAALGVGLAAGVLAFRHATALLAVFVALMPVGLFAAGLAALLVR